MKNSIRFPLMACSSLALILSATVQAASHRKIVFIDQYDQNLDGKVSSVEFETARWERFRFTDTNNNGVLNEEEYVYEWEDHLDAQLAHDRQEQVGQTATRFMSLNRDGDDVISWEEFEASGEYSFGRFDSNGDGIISDADEDTMAAAMAEREAGMTREQILADQKRILSMPSTHNKQGTITQYDRDGNETVTHEEFAMGRQEYFSAMDADDSGAITEDEYLYEFEDRLDAALNSTRRASVDQTIVRFDALDGDDNGLMTYEEYQMSGHRSFKRWDTDGDGYVTFEEADPVEPEFSSSNDTDDEDQSV